MSDRCWSSWPPTASRACARRWARWTPTVWRCASPPPIEAPGAAGEAFQFGLVGQDRPGIVDQVTAVFSGLGANIERFNTWIQAEPHSGAPLFHMQASLRLPPDLPAARVQAALEAISAEIMVDFSLTPAP